MCPAYNLNLESVIFTSASGASKNSDIAKVDQSEEKEFKVTLKDASKEVERTSDVTKSGKTISVPYNYTGSDVDQVSIVLTSGDISKPDTTVLYYGKLADGTNTSGTGTFDLPANIPAGYKAYILAEDLNDGMNTDYSSAPREIKIPSTVTYDWGNEAPAGKTVPQDTGSYKNGDSYTVDTTYKTGDTVAGEKDGKKGTWTFSGWTDPNNGTMGDKDITITGSWIFKEAPKHKVTYDWGNEAPVGKTVPQDTGSYKNGDSYTVDTTYKTGDTVAGKKDGKKGTWTFSGWTDPNNGTMGDKDVTITGTWTFAEADKHRVIYDWGTDAPATETKPVDKDSYYKGDPYKVDDKYTKGKTVEGTKGDKKGTWTFSGWTDPNNGTMGDKNVTVKGEWTFEEAPKHKVTYDWGKDAPDTANLPEDSNKYYKGEKCTVDTAYKKGDTVPGKKDGKKGTWTFSGWDKTGEFDIDGNTVIKGSWTFKADPDPVNPKDPTNPKDPGNPKDPTTPANNGGNDGKAPGIGESSNLALWISLMALAGMGATWTTIYGRRKRQK